MIYLLSGPNSYRALRKIKELKTAFFKKRGNLPVEELDGEGNETTVADFRSALGQGSLFSAVRMVIFKNVLGEDKNILETLRENADFAKNSKDVFVFWEKDIAKPALSFFKKYAEKIQEMSGLDGAGLGAWLARRARELGVKLGTEEKAIMISEAGEEAEWALENMLEKMVLGGGLGAKKIAGVSASPFALVEKLVSAPLSRALLALKEAEVSGQDIGRLIYPLLWKIKQKRMSDAYFKGIQAESAMRRDPKNAYEILERFILALKA